MAFYEEDFESNKRTGKHPPVRVTTVASIHKFVDTPEESWCPFEDFLFSKSLIHTSVSSGIKFGWAPQNLRQNQRSAHTVDRWQELAFYRKKLRRISRFRGHPEVMRVLNCPQSNQDTQIRCSTIRHKAFALKSNIRQQNRGRTFELKTDDTLITRGGVP